MSRDLTAPIALLRAGLDASWRRLLDCPGDDFTREVALHRDARDVLDNAADNDAEVRVQNVGLCFIRVFVDDARHPERELQDEPTATAIPDDALRETVVDVRAMALRLRDAPPSDEAHAATLRAASLASQLATAERALTERTRERDDDRDEFRAYRSAVGALAAGRPLDLAALADRLDGCALDALRTLAARLDAHPPQRAPGVGAGVDWRYRYDLLAALAHDITSGAVVDVNDLQTGELPAADVVTLRAMIAAREPRSGADEGAQELEREGVVTRVVVADGVRIVSGRAPNRAEAIDDLGARVLAEGVAFCAACDLAQYEGRRARVVVEVGGEHVATVATATPVVEGP